MPRTRGEIRSRDGYQPEKEHDMTQTADKPVTREEAFTEDLPEGKSCLYNLDHTGDSKFMWSSTNPDEVEAAKKTFKRLKDRGYTAYKVRSDGSKGEVIREFDPDAEKIIMAPQMVGG